MKALPYSKLEEILRDKEAPLSEAESRCYELRLECKSIRTTVDIIDGSKDAQPEDDKPG